MRTTTHLSLKKCLYLSSCYLLAAYACHANTEESNRIVKWKDEKGATHYGDRIPPQYANTESSLINKQGITVKRNKPVNYQEQALDTAKLEQDKKDVALLSAFTSANEIDLAKDRNLQLDKSAYETLLLDKMNSAKRLTESTKYADELTKRKKPIPTDLSNEIKTNQLEVTKNEKLLSERKAVIETTTKRFDEDKKRFIALKNHSIGKDTLTETNSK